MDIKEEILAQMDSALRPEFDKAIDNTIEGAFKEDVKTLGFMVASSIKCQWEVMKPHLFYAYCLGVKAQEAKAQAMPAKLVMELKAVITKALHANFAEWTEDQAEAVIEAIKQEGFAVVSHKDLLGLTVAINAVDMATHTESKTNEVREMWQDIALKLMALGEAQDSNNGIQ